MVNNQSSLQKSEEYTHVWHQKNLFCIAFLPFFFGRRDLACIIHHTSKSVQPLLYSKCNRFSGLFTTWGHVSVLGITCELWCFLPRYSIETPGSTRKHHSKWERRGGGFDSEKPSWTVWIIVLDFAVLPRSLRNLEFLAACDRNSLELTWWLQFHSHILNERCWKRGHSVEWYVFYEPQCPHFDVSEV